jgi:hypothetical protein
MALAPDDTNVFRLEWMHAVIGAGSSRSRATSPDCHASIQERSRVDARCIVRRTEPPSDTDDARRRDAPSAASIGAERPNIGG